MTDNIRLTKRLPSSNFLKSTCDDEVSLIHCYKISGKLGREVILFFKVIPVDVKIRIFGFLQCVSDGTLQEKNRGLVS